MNNKKCKLILRNVVLYLVYTLSAIFLLLIYNINSFINMSGGNFFMLIFIRTLNLCALRPLNPYFHGNPIKYHFQKKGDLARYKRLVTRFEIFLVFLATLFFIIGLIM